jgi:hypothetical protein
VSLSERQSLLLQAVDTDLLVHPVKFTLVQMSHVPPKLYRPRVGLAHQPQVFLAKTSPFEDRAGGSMDRLRFVACGARARFAVQFACGIYTGKVGSCPDFNFQDQCN